MSLNSAWKTIRQDVEHFGLAKTVYDLCFRTINRFVYFKILKAMKIEEANPDYLETEARFRWQFFTMVQLRELSRTPEYDLNEDSLERSLENGDACYGAMDGDVLACYSWYSNEPTEAAHGLTLHFDSDYIYMYKAFTNPAYRGKRLHSVAMNRALRDYLHRGFKGLVGIIESNNFSSLNSVYRIGYQDFGRLFVLKIGEYPLLWASRGCREQGFYLSKSKPAPAAQPALTPVS